jgi:DNA-directed RNA polymerase specialized sigma24 family protein
MRQILVDSARGRRAVKRGADWLVELDGTEEDAVDWKGKPMVQELRSADLVLTEDASKDLARIDEQQRRLVEWRFFGDLTVEEAPEVLRISRSTVKRDWNVAKAWLSRQLKRGRHGRERKLAKD